MTEPDPPADMSTSNFRLHLMKESLERAHMFRDGPSIFGLDTLGIQRPRKESDGVLVHLFGLDEELLGNMAIIVLSASCKGGTER